MKFKKYVKESNESATTMNTLNENFLDNDWNPDKPSFVQDEIERFYGPVKKMIDEGNFEEARAELAELEADLNDLEETNSKKKFFKFPQFMINAERERIEALKAKLPKNESVEDMDKRCEKCNTLLNDSGTCPKCDDGEEDYGDETAVNEELSVREKLKSAYPELNFDTPITEDVIEETMDISNREKLKRAFPELNFTTTETTELQEDNLAESTITTEELSNKEKLKKAYPELNMDAASSGITESQETFEYDDEYDIEDDVEMDRRHAALYGGDRTYCNCGKKLVRTDWGSYCPDCDPETAEEEHIRMIDDDVNNEYFFGDYEKR